MKVAVLAILVALVAYAGAQATTSIDEFTVDQNVINVNAGTPVATASATTANGSIIGTERDTQMTLASASAPTCINGRSTTGSVNPTGGIDTNGDGVPDDNDVGIFEVASDQSCFATTLLQYDGVDGGAATLSFAPGLPNSVSNFRSYASAFRLRYFSDLPNRNFNIRVYTSAAASCSITLQTTGGNIIDNRVIDFNQLTGNCDYTNIRAIEIEFPAQSNFDVIISIFELITTTASGVVYVDCACDNTIDAIDQRLNGITVTLTPGAGCPSGTQTQTTTTDANGAYRFLGLPACAFTVSSTVASLSPCTTSSRSVTTVFGTEVTANIPYRGDASFTVPPAVTVTCIESTAPGGPKTGTASSTSTCNGNSQVTSSDAISLGNCDGNYIITRTWTDGTNTGTQKITVTDTKVGPSITCPAPITVDCDSSLKPAITGRPTVSDDCSNDIDVIYTGVDAPGTCNGNCLLPKIVTRTFRAVDDCGNQSAGSCDQTITITPCAAAKTCPNPANCHNSSIFYRAGQAPVDA